MASERVLQPLEFHLALASTLEQHEPGLWRWFAGDDYGKKYAENVKLELLRATYRLPRESHEKLYAIATEVAQVLGVTVPLTLYQSQGSGVLNAGLVFAATAGVERHRRVACGLGLRQRLGQDLGPGIDAPRALAVDHRLPVHLHRHADIFRRDRVPVRGRSASAMRALSSRRCCCCCGKNGARRSTGSRKR